MEPKELNVSQIYGQHRSCPSQHTTRGKENMEQFATEAEVMRAAADRTDDTNADVNREIDRVQQVAEATRGYWVGNAQRSFDDLMLRYDDANRP